jgi:hypothetical protein
MQSWSLKKFVDINGVVFTGELWGVSHQAVSGAIKSKRNIKVTLIDGVYEIFETKQLMKGVRA